MLPVIIQGSSFELDRYFDENDFSEGLVVFFSKYGKNNTYYALLDEIKKKV